MKNLMFPKGDSSFRSPSFRMTGYECHSEQREESIFISHFEKFKMIIKQKRVTKRQPLLLIIYRNIIKFFTYFSKKYLRFHYQ